MSKKRLTDIAEEIIGSPDTIEAPQAAEERTEEVFLVDTTPSEYEYDEEYHLLKSFLPKGVDVRDALDYGFYEFKRRYWIRRKNDTFQPVSNFTIRVLFLIIGANPKRIVEITNVHGRKTVLDFAIEDLISIEKFKGRVESVGNYLFEGTASDLARIKNKLFTLEKASLEVSRLGQQRDKFFAFANGIYDGHQFYEVDDKGMVTHDDNHYFIPVFGSTTSEDDEDLRNYRKFVHRPSNINITDWANQFLLVYGDNGRVAIAFLLYTLFSDIVFDKTKSAPMLFLFGQRGSGKGTMAISLMNAFGFPQDPLMLGGASTVVGFMRKLGQFQNSIVWLDEYKNDIGEKKIESLKNIWDRVGYERGVKDSSNRTQTTPVTSTAILSGQEIPNVEPALFSRTILCEFRTFERTQQQIEWFDLLRKMEEIGITNITLEILKHRKVVKEKFFDSYSDMSAMFRQKMMGYNIIDRQINNNAILCAMVQILGDTLKLPIKTDEICDICEKYMKKQAIMMRQANEVQQFFEMLQYLISLGELKFGEDVDVKDGFILVRMVKAIPLYREHSRRQNQRALDKGTLVNYMQVSEAYDENMSKKGNHRFSKLQNPTSATVFLQSKIEQLYNVFISENTQSPENQEINETPIAPALF